MQSFILDHDCDAFHGVTIDLGKLSMNVNEFNDRLIQSLDTFRQQKKRGVWLRIPQEKSEYIPIGVNQQFQFHHCQPEYIMLILWLPDPTIDPNLIPVYPVHYVGCGALVVDWELQKILLITENRKVSDESEEQMWKIPGGAYDDTDETLGTCAEREVLEETGIESKHQTVLGFRYMHNYSFGKPDLYFICLLQAVTKQIRTDKEIAKCKWVPLSDYFQMKGLYNVQMQAMNMLQKYIETGKSLDQTDVSESGFTAEMYRIL
jgi:8-oxo-dGTP pyrophosphatase MutT (NUDIX family)